MKKFLSTLLAIIVSLCIISVFAFTAIQMVVFDQSRFETAYEKYDRYEFIGISSDDLHEVTREMIKYLKGEREDLIMHANIDGEMQQVFEEREILHMVDVQKLFLGGMMIRNISIIVGFFAIALLILMARKETLNVLSKTYFWVFLAFVLLAAIIGIMMLIDFSAMFWKFHLLFFDNDLWLLDIDNDVLIQMFPEEFFNEMAIAMVTWGAGSVVIVAAAAGAYRIRRRKKRGKA